MDGDAEDKGAVVTVEGRLDPDDLGKTLTHEHLFIDSTDAYYKPPTSEPGATISHKPMAMEDLWYIRRNSFSHQENMRLDSFEEASEEVARIIPHGGDSIVDVTPKGVGSNPRQVRNIARETGLNIVHGTGYYVKPTHPRHVAGADTADLRREFVRDVQEGIGETDVRAGIIGEIGLSGNLSEKNVLRAGAQAAIETGAPLSIHPPMHTGEHPAVWGMRIADIIEGEGLPLERVIMCHMDQVNEIKFPEITPQIELADRGVYIEFDVWGWESYMEENQFPTPSDNWRLNATHQLIEAGYLAQLLFSQDVGVKWRYTKYGGLGYAHVLRDIVPMLKRHYGVSKRQIETILVENPKRVLTFTEPIQ